jgi:hypothetical protein
MDQVKAATRPIVAFVFGDHGTLGWQRELAARIRASGLCETVELHAGHAEGDLLGAHAQTPPSKRHGYAAIVDFTGEFNRYSQSHTTEGVWRLCDDRGIVLGAKDHGLEAITLGVGARLYLIATTEAKTTLIDSAAVYVEPCASVSPQRQCMMAETLLLSALREISTLGALEPRAAFLPRRRRMSVVQRCLLKVRGRIKKLARWLAHVLLIEQWMVGIVDMPMSEAIGQEHLPIRWIGKHSSSFYWADPFGVPDRRDEIYCEEYDFRLGSGRIVKLPLDGSNVRGQPQPVDLNLSGHLSYPFLLRHDGALYCVAESAQSRCCVLNRCDDNGVWAQAAILLPDAAVADPTIFEHGGYFWLAYTDVSLGAFDNLCLCYASDLLGPWRAHPQNPVKIDHCSARPGGTVVKVGEALMRVAQVCSSGYGQAIAVNRILHCMPDFYREEVVGMVSPKRGSSNPHGLHTMSEWGNSTLVDGKRYRLSPMGVARKIASRLTRAGHVALPSRSRMCKTSQDM